MRKTYTETHTHTLHGYWDALMLHMILLHFIFILQYELRIPISMCNFPQFIGVFCMVFFSLSRLPFLDSILFFRMIVLVGYCCHCCHWHCHYGVGTINPHPRRLSRMRCVCTFFRRNEMKWAWAWASMARILCWSFVRVQWHQVNWRLQLHCVYMRE